MTFTVPIEKEVTRTDKNGEEITKNICYLFQFIDSARFMARSLSNLVINLPEVIHKIKCKFEYDDKKRKTCGIKYKYFLTTTIISLFIIVVKRCLSFSIYG